jgi:nitrate reductase (NAD(P)H)
MRSPAPSLSDRGSSESETITGTCSSPASSLDELVDDVTAKSESKSAGDFAEPVSFIYTEAPGLPPVPDSDTPLVVDETDINTPDRWVKRDPRLVRLTGKHPFNSEAKLDTLFAAGFLTPISLFYVRNHGAVPKVSADRARNWKVRVHGLVQREVIFSIADLKRMFPVVTLPITLVCAGNRRKEQNMVEKSLGFNWGAAGLSTALFTGVYLADVLEYVKPKRPNSKHVVFEGADTDLPNGPYGTSQKLSVAANREKGMLITWKMNGLDLEPDHGFPLRMVIPGQIGGRSVKWLTRIEISEVESQHYVGLHANFTA